MNLGTLQPRDPYGAVHCGKLCAARRRRVVEQVRAHGLRPHRLFVGRARGGGLALLRPPTLPGQGARRRVRQEQAVSGRPQTVPRGRLRLRPRYDYTANTAAQLWQMQYDTLRYEMLF